MTYNVFFCHVLLRRNTVGMHWINISHKNRSASGHDSPYDHIHVVSQLQEKANEFKIPFSALLSSTITRLSTHAWSPPRSSEHWRTRGLILPASCTVLRDPYNGATSTLKLRRDGDKIRPKKGARQGDHISPKLFTGCLQDSIISRINYRKRKEST